MRSVLLTICLLAAGCATIPPADAPPVPYAWAVFNEDGIVESGASGAADRAAGRALTIDDPVRIASVSKLVVALGVMRMVEQGQLDLDADVSRWLGWRLRNPAFPDRPISLRQLLSHTSSLTDRVDYAVPLGTSLRSVVEQERAFDREQPPGRHFRYANLNYPVIASVMERASGERFDRLMERLVLRPLQLDACFNWTTCSPAAMARAVVLYAPDGSVIRDDLRGRRPDCPVLAPEGSACDLSGYEPGSNGALFSPQGGLRVSVRNLAAVGRLLLNRGSHGGAAFLRPDSVAALSGLGWRYDGSNGETEGGFYCRYALAVHRIPTGQEGCRDDLFGDGRTALGHAGEAYGVRSGLWVDPASGSGIAFFATGNGDAPPRGRHSAFMAVEEWLAARLQP